MDSEKLFLNKKEFLLYTFIKHYIKNYTLLYHYINGYN
ncbi:hypothetical protein DF16_orf03179 [Bacillus thuringiensis serovar kurstaki str. YBT-1520]|nr:hypothetical protein HD73_3055 [Bacillus thuringiensis serovar kurstaki str. HD73]AIM31594.1 hypothetical protein DF16_orf03179 [Bacillus thuringiensis serovar kurstaki str. YBT-1520]KLA04568.1 hypothetical protein B4158_2888 [Bacillus cereus]